MYMNVASAIPPPTPSTVGMSGYVGSSRAKQLMEFYPPPLRVRGRDGPLLRKLREWWNVRRTWHGAL